MGILDRIVKAVGDRRHPGYVAHPLAGRVRQRVFQMGCGYEDANDGLALRQDPALKAACDRLPVTGADLASQPTMSRFENQISRSDLYRIAQAFVDLFIASYKKPPQAILLDIDDTEDKVHGSQQWSLFNGYFKSKCYQPLHIYEGQTGQLITTLLRPGARPSGPQIVTLLKRLFCDWNEVYFALGQAANAPLSALVHPLMAQAKALVQESGQPVQLFTSFPYQAQTWAGPRRIICKAEVTASGQAHARFVVTNLDSSQPSFIYQTIYCGRGRMEGFIKHHKTFLHSDHTSCHTFEANHFRLFLHSAAYVLIHALSDIGLAGTSWMNAQFNTLQHRILKVAGKVCELNTLVRFHLPSSFSLKPLYGTILCNLAKAGP